jgi:hypothetical protein
MSITTIMQYVMTDNGLVASNNDSYDLYNSANILLSLKYHYIVETTEDQSEDDSESINEDDDNIIIKKTTNSIPYGSKVKIIKDNTYKSYTGIITKSKHGFYTVLLDNVLISIKLRWHEFQVI